MQYIYHISYSTINNITERMLEIEKSNLIYRRYFKILIKIKNGER